MTEQSYNPDLGRVALQNHPTQGKLPMKGGCAVLFGLPFLGAGVLITLAAADVVGRPEDKHAPDWVIYGAGALFGLAGLMLVSMGAWAWIRNKLRANASLRRPDAPWLWDRKWNHRGESYLGLGQLVSGLLFTVFVGIFFGVFYGTFWQERGRGGFDFMIWIFMGVMSLMVLIAVGWTLYTLMRILKYGLSYVSFSRFPFRVGETIQVGFQLPRGLRGFTTIDFHLQLVEEVVEVRNTSDGRSSQLVAYRIYRHTRQVHPQDIAPGQKQLNLEFEIPSDQPGNLLAEHPARYWQLQVESETPGVDYKAFFLLPVYG